MVRPAMRAQIPRALVFVSVLVCIIPPRVIAAETAGAPVPAAKAQADSKEKPPLIVHNPDGTITVQKPPASGKGGDAKKGLVIPPQVVVPTARGPANDPPNQAR